MAKTQRLYSSSSFNKVKPAEAMTFLASAVLDSSISRQQTPFWCGWRTKP